MGEEPPSRPVERPSGASGRARAERFAAGTLLALTAVGFGLALVAARTAVGEVRAPLLSGLLLAGGIGLLVGAALLTRTTGRPALGIAGLALGAFAYLFLNALYRVSLVAILLTWPTFHSLGERTVLPTFLTGLAFFLLAQGRVAGRSRLARVGPPIGVAAGGYYLVGLAAMAFVTLTVPITINPTGFALVSLLWPFYFAAFTAPQLTPAAEPVAGVLIAWAVGSILLLARQGRQA